jgi:hypothetical protein
LVGYEIGRVEIILAGNANQREQCIAAGIGQRRSHAVWRCRFTDGTDWPIRRDPLSRSVRQHRGEVDNLSRLIDRGGLDGGDFMLAQHFAYDVEPAR